MKLSDQESVTTREENSGLVFYKSVDRGLADGCLGSFRYGAKLDIERD